MLDIFFYFLFTRTYVFIAILFCSKIVFVLTSEYRSRSLAKFFYYPYMNMVLTENPKKIRYKKIQNNLTFAIMFLVMVQSVFLCLLFILIKT